jgi:predicted flap endonuclease-1-like 5' DNA nuclease
MNILKIEGIGPANAAKLAAHGVKTTGGLLKAAATRAGRKDLAAKSGIDESRILAWANRADLMRVKGVGEEYSDLLELAGVDTVKELSKRNAPNLHKAMMAAQEAKKVVRRPPTVSMVERWIESAKMLDPMMQY